MFNARVIHLMLVKNVVVEINVMGERLPLRYLSLSLSLSLYSSHFTIVKKQMCEKNRTYQRKLDFCTSYCTLNCMDELSAECQAHCIETYAELVCRVFT